ncbi:hypothetical protein DPMN_175830 [Dreissena polymorpha]|uniref:Uncharacterized protein n=1 Tax=Dreissena polymorpha TaxID=45954 RepID=A0A9D4E802_DREPO|nr:hypothetical protein DPMN_175830 [Dreissena polymorpha]
MAPGKFTWLCWDIVADTEKEEPSHNEVYANKMALKKYMELFEEGVQMINSKRQSKPKGTFLYSYSLCNIYFANVKT